MARMDRREFLQLAGASALLSGLGATAPPRRLPNIVLVLIDDFGWRDLGCCGSDYYETPRIDAFAAQSVRFTQFYAPAPVCSPTRAAILCGQSPARLHMTQITTGDNPEDRKLLVPEWRRFLPPEEVTLAEALRDAGYATGCIGKWHLGETVSPDYGPASQGFDFVRMHGPSGGDKFVSTFTDSALEFIGERKDRPFFLYLAHHTVHVPYEAPAELVERFHAKQPGSSGQNNPMMAAMISVLDDGMGRLLDGIDQLGVADDTIVIFTSDNGGLSLVRDEETGQIVNATSNSPLRGGKAQLYEGGIRTPFIVRWPGKLDGGREIATPAIATDIFPSLLALAGLPAQPERHRDGIDVLSPLCSGGVSGPPASRDALYWHYPHYHASTRPHSAVRRGDLKLIEHYEDGALELYDLRDDPSESRNLTPERPDTAQELRALLHRSLEEACAQMPSPNPGYRQAGA